MSGEVEKGLKKIGVTASKPVLALIAIISGIRVMAFQDSLQGLLAIRHNTGHSVLY